MHSGPSPHIDQTRNPWTTHDSREVYANPWIRVREDRVTRPDGSPGIYGVVEMTNVATGIIALRDDGMIPLVGQWRYPLAEWSWEIPEGGAPAGEDPLAAAQRELREETGLSADSWELILRSHLSNCVTAEVAMIYRATGLTQGRAATDDDERLIVRWVALTEAAAMVRRGEITDAVSQLGILVAAGASSP